MWLISAYVPTHERRQVTPSQPQPQPQPQPILERVGGPAYSTHPTHAAYQGLMGELLDASEQYLTEKLKRRVKPTDCLLPTTY